MKQSALGLTAREHIALGSLMDDSARERHGSDERNMGPWERSWVRARNNPALGRAYASLARKGLIEAKGHGESRRYRWRKEP